MDRPASRRDCWPHNQSDPRSEAGPYGATCGVAVARSANQRITSALGVDPTHLVLELKCYIDGERAECTAVGRRHGFHANPESLFVNGTASRHDAGKPIRTETLSRAFTAAVRTAGLTHSVTKTDPESGALYQSAEAAHTFHDARHTFAAWLYHAERAGGNAEPWKIVQARLGHRQLATTLNTYLRVVDDYRTEVNLSVYKFLREKFGN